MAFASRQLRALITVVLLVAVGCHPLQPVYFGEDGDMSHYLDVATQLEEPDVVVETLAEVDAAAPPRLINAADWDQLKEWNLTLEEAIQIALANSEILRTLGGRIGPVEGAPEALLSAPGSVLTSFDVALHETNPGNSNYDVLGRGRGVEAALADFDATFNTQMLWNQNDRPVNVSTAATSIFQRVIVQDQTRFVAELAKPNAMGGQSALRHSVTYDQNNNPTRLFASDYNVEVELEIRQPLLQGAGAQFNRIFGPSTSINDARGTAQGVLMARIGTDLALADVQVRLAEFVREVEEAYWELYFDYRSLQVNEQATRDATEAWQEARAKATGSVQGGGESYFQHRARALVHTFRGQSRNSKAVLLKDERHLRYLMGLSTDERIIVPIDEPTRAFVRFDSQDVLAEALGRRPELRRQKWEIRRAEYELTAAKNFLLPRIDFIGQYRFLGLGDDLISANRTGSSSIPSPYAWESLTSGRFQEWTLGFVLEKRLGNRRENAKLRNGQIAVLQQRKKLQEQELEMVVQVQDALANTERYYLVCEDAYNAMMSYENEVAALDLAEEVINTPYEKFEALQRLSNARTTYYDQLVEYNKALRDVHWRKGSLLEYNGVLMAEGPWPSKAYYDARGEARKTDASRSLNYGVTRPGVTSRGPVSQQQGIAPSRPAPAGDGRGPTPAQTAPEEPIVPEELPPAITNDTARLTEAELEILR